MKKFLLLLLAAILIITPVMTACNNGEDEVEDENVENEVSGEANPDDRLSYAFSPNIPEGTKFDGKKFSMLLGSVGDGFYAEEDTGDLVKDAVYQRNALIEEHFGIELDIPKSGYGHDGKGQDEAGTLFRSLIEAGDESYHAFVHVQSGGGMPQMVLENYFVDWNTIPYVNLDDEWWYQNIKRDLCFGDKIYMMTGDYALYIDRIDCLVFNKEIFDELGLEYPYQDVLDGTWTWEKFTDLVKQGADDLNGDGLMTFEDDQWGLVGWGYEMIFAMQVASGYSPLSRDENNMPVLNENIDEVHGIFDQIVNLFADGEYAWSEYKDYSGQNTMFSEGRAMFKELFLTEIARFSDTEFEYGILPMPKWTEDAPYYSRSSNMTPLTYIPVTNPDLELTGAVLEEMAFQSAKTLTPTYFDVVLTVKQTRDVQSEAMLPIIKNNARFLYHDFNPDINGMVRNRNNTYSSTFSASLSSYQERLEEMRELLLGEK